MPTLFNIAFIYYLFSSILLYWFLALADYGLSVGLTISLIGSVSWGGLSIYVLGLPEASPLARRQIE